jgi:hypothetical protein
LIEPSKGLKEEEVVAEEVAVEEVAAEEGVEEVAEDWEVHQQHRRFNQMP